MITKFKVYHKGEIITVTVDWSDSLLIIAEKISRKLMEITGKDCFTINSEVRIKGGTIQLEKYEIEIKES